MTPKDVIDRLGGYRAVALEIPCDPTRVFRWQSEGIPGHRWPRILQIAQTHAADVSLDMLMSTQPERASA